MQAIGQNPNPNAQNTNKITTSLTDSSLSRFAGWKRPHDSRFVHTQSCSEFLRDAESLMQSRNITDDNEKNNFLVELADETIGDFNYQIPYV